MAPGKSWLYEPVRAVRMDVRGRFDDDCEQRHELHGRESGYSGHVRIVGIDEWTYMVEPAMPGARATLQRLYHLDDLA